MMQTTAEALLRCYTSRCIRNAALMHPRERIGILCWPNGPAGSCRSSASDAAGNVAAEQRLRCGCCLPLSDYVIWQGGFLAMAQDFDKNDASLSAALLTLQPRPERKLLRKSGGECAIDFLVRVVPSPEQKSSNRASLRLALVLDRSGSMQGEKLTLAKRAALAVLDHLSGRDSVAVVTFDNQIDVIQSVAPVTPALKRQVQATLQHIEARASTALHEGWLTGCNALTSDVGSSAGGELARCFLLTDGIANVGVVDPERIASERSEEHTSELQSRQYLVCRLLLENKNHTSELQSRQYRVFRLRLVKQRNDIRVIVVELARASRFVGGTTAAGWSCVRVPRYTHVPD